MKIYGEKEEVYVIYEQFIKSPLVFLEICSFFEKFGRLEFWIQN